jgi:ubiquinone/menaquinone biosynthesis C-methylase UbiE
MNEPVRDRAEQSAAEAFSKQSSIFDQIYGSNVIIHYKRERVRSHVQRLIAPNSAILELNAGTGEDAIWFAQQGHHVHATDIAEGMQNVLTQKVQQAGLSGKVSTEICSFNSLAQLKRRGPYDLIFSNFAGLNCTGELDKVIQSFVPLLKQGGIATLVILPKFCLWETLSVFKGRFKTAFRRFFSKNGVKAHIEGVYFTCWYYNPSYIKQAAGDQFDIIGVEGLCTIVPPSYMENFPAKLPRLYRWLMKKENKWKSAWPWRSIGDYYIISLRKR